MEEHIEYDKSALNLRLETHVRNGVVYVSLPKIFCKKFGLIGKEGEEVEFIIHTIYKDYKSFDLCRVDYKKQ